MEIKIIVLIFLVIIPFVTVVSSKYTTRKLFEKHIGVLRIESSEDPVNPYIFLELSKEIDNFRSKKYIILKVLDENYPQN